VSGTNAPNDTSSSDEYILKRVNGTHCLDGSPAAYYARVQRRSTFAVVHLQGGGWCFSDDECLRRSKTNLGTSSSYQARTAVVPDLYGAGQLMQRFSEFSHYVVNYCDGGSWLGTVTSPRNGLHLSGRNTLNATMHDIVSHNPRLSRILFTGCSAGGLGVVHACAWVSREFPDITFKCVHDGSLFFGDMVAMKTYHNSALSPTLEDIVTSSETSAVFSVTDVWDWDFFTSDECKKDVETCSVAEQYHIAQRAELLERVKAPKWITRVGHHCQLGVALSSDLAKHLTDYFHDRPLASRSDRAL